MIKRPEMGRLNQYRMIDRFYAKPLSGEMNIGMREIERV